MNRTTSATYSENVKASHRKNSEHVSEHKDLLGMPGQDTQRCVIIGGADIGRPERIRRYVRRDDYIVCCDSGLRHMEALGVQPDLIVGDFDSHGRPNLPIETIVLPCEKDDTDTVFAVKECLRRGFDEYVLLGVMGGRMDHALCNISILFMLESEHKRAMAADDYSEYMVAGHDTVFVADRYPFFSLLSLAGTARGITIRNAKYPLENAEITPDYQYGVSNEVLPGRTAEITVTDGRLLVIADLDR